MKTLMWINPIVNYKTYLDWNQARLTNLTIDTHIEENIKLGRVNSIMALADSSESLLFLDADIVVVRPIIETEISGRDVAGVVVLSQDWRKTTEADPAWSNLLPLKSVPSFNCGFLWFSSVTLAKTIAARWKAVIQELIACNGKKMVREELAFVRTLSEGTYGTSQLNRKFNSPEFFSDTVIYHDFQKRFAASTIVVPTFDIRTP